MSGSTQGPLYTINIFQGFWFGRHNTSLFTFNIWQVITQGPTAASGQYGLQDTSNVSQEGIGHDLSCHEELRPKLSRDRLGEVICLSNWTWYWIFTSFYDALGVWLKDLSIQICACYWSCSCCSCCSCCYCCYYYDVFYITYYILLSSLLSPISVPHLHRFGLESWCKHNGRIYSWLRKHYSRESIATITNL